MELQTLNNRLGLDFSFYKRKTVDLITPLDVSSATGSSNLWLNAGDIENRGIELILSGTPIKTDNFSWNVKFNFAKIKVKLLV